MPELFEVIVHTGDDVTALPHPDVPYYVVAKEGMFIHRNTQIGRVLQKTTRPAEGLGKIGHPEGVFYWVGERIPGKIISQATAFFRRIYDKHQTEAEVILTMHNETREISIFVPHQRVSGAGVKSIFEPTNIRRSHTIVGSIHSHCHFSAFHSGVDTADAADMDGVHFTIGMLQNTPPQIVAMVSMGGKNYHYHKPEEIAELEFDTETAPPWWDNFVYTGAVPTDKPAGLKTLTQAQWDTFRGVVIKSHSTASTYRGPITGQNGYRPHWSPDTPSENRWGPNRAAIPFQPTTESAIFNKTVSKREAKRIARLESKRQRDALDEQHTIARLNRLTNPKWNEDGSLQIGDSVWGPDSNGIFRPMVFETNPADDQIDTILDMALSRNLLSEEDWTAIMSSEIDDISFWKHKFIMKMTDIATVLEAMGMTVSLTIAPKKPRITPVKGQTTMLEYQERVITQQEN